MPNANLPKYPFFTSKFPLNAPFCLCPVASRCLSSSSFIMFNLQVLTREQKITGFGPSRPPRVRPLGHPVPSLAWLQRQQCRLPRQVLFASASFFQGHQCFQTTKSTSSSYEYCDTKDFIVWIEASKMITRRSHRSSHQIWKRTISSIGCGITSNRWNASSTGVVAGINVWCLSSSLFFSAPAWTCSGVMMCYVSLTESVSDSGSIVCLASSSFFPSSSR